MTQVQPNEHDSNFQSDVWSDELLTSAPRWQEAMQLLSEEGFGGMAQALTILINEAMKLERSAVLGARPFERTAQRRGRANGFKPKTVNTRVGALELRVPQTRDVPF